MDFLNSKNITYITFFGAFLAYIFGYVPDFLWDVSTGLSIAAMLGFSSVAALRTFIKVNGWKTYVFTAGGVIVAVLHLAGVLTVETMESLITLFASLSGFSLADGVVKKIE